jgi:hypothetical protein
MAELRAYVSPYTTTATESDQEPTASSVAAQIFSAVRPKVLRRAKERAAAKEGGTAGTSLGSPAPFERELLRGGVSKTDMEEDDEIHIEATGWKELFSKELHEREQLEREIVNTSSAQSQEEASDQDGEGPSSVSKEGIWRVKTMRRLKKIRRVKEEIAEMQRFDFITDGVEPEPLREDTMEYYLQSEHVSDEEEERIRYTMERMTTDDIYAWNRCFPERWIKPHDPVRETEEGTAMSWVRMFELVRSIHKAESTPVDSKLVRFMLQAGLQTFSWPSQTEYIAIKKKDCSMLIKTIKMWQEAAAKFKDFLNLVPGTLLGRSNMELHIEDDTMWLSQPVTDPETKTTINVKSKVDRESLWAFFHSQRVSPSVIQKVFGKLESKEQEAE